MIALTGESLANEMMSCYENFNRKVGIAFPSHKIMRDFAMSLQRQQREGSVPATYYKNMVDEIFFNTGSSIRMVNASEPRNLYGLIFDKVLYDPDISEKEVLAHLKSCERVTVAHKAGSEMEIDTQPLDDFLGEFNIVG